jgi:iron complex outermembrane recepter protein
VYGTDAIAGVINFILRKDFRGVEATATLLDTEHGGGKQERFTGSIGFGDLSKDRFNVFVTADHLKQDPLKAADRAISHTAFLPALGYDRTSGNSLPANISQPGGFSSTRNPTIPFTGATSTSCLPPFSFPTTGSPRQCRFDFASVIETIPNFTKDNFMGRAALQLAPDHQAFVEASYYKGTFDNRISPTPAGPGTVQENPLNATMNPSSPFYPTAYIASLPGGNVTLPIQVSWRTLELGPRWDEAKVNQTRIVAGLQGLIANWDYSTSVNYTENQQTDTYRGGYVSENGLGALIQNGTVNPFGFNTPAALTAMQATQIVGDASKNKAKNYGWDAKISNELMQLPAGPLAVALGVDYRKEKLDLINADFLSSGDVWGGGGAIPSLTGVDRTVSAFFGEVNIPILRNLEMNVAARWDHYSDFGSTTNPKVTLRWTPTRELLVRAAYGTGFRAPTLYDLFQPFLITNTPGAWDDPIRCPVTGLVTDCNLQFNAKQGGNAALQPEKSKQWYAGLVWEPSNQMSIGVDYYKIYIRNLISAITDGTIFGDYNRYAATQVVRGAVDPNFPNLPGPIAFVLENTINVGKQSTSGVDVDVTYRFPSTTAGRFAVKYNGAYVLSWKQQTFDSTDYPDSVGIGGSGVGYYGVIPRYRHYATLDWTSGAWGATLAQTYQDSYKEQDYVTGGERRVGAYELYDLQGRWTGWKNLSVKLGVRNIFDRAPPVSNQAATFQAGYDPSYGDPRGRMYYGTVQVSFK